MNRIINRASRIVPPIFVALMPGLCSRSWQPLEVIEQGVSTAARKQFPTERFQCRSFARILQLTAHRRTIPYRVFPNLTPRLGYSLGFLVCLALLGFALYLQYFAQQEPCPLCIMQRFAFIALAGVFLVAALHGPGRIGSIIYGGLLFVIAGIGAAIATRHVWLQHLPKNQVPECGPGLEYMLRKYPLGQVLDKILSGSGECAETGWTFLGLSIAGWSLLWFVVMGVFAVCLAVLSMRRAAGR